MIKWQQLLRKNLQICTQDGPTREKLRHKAIDTVRELRDISRRCAGMYQVEVNLCADTVVEYFATGILASRFHNWIANRYQRKAKELEAR